MRASRLDSIDADVLADLLRADLIAEAYHAPKGVRAWKELVRARMALVRLQTQVKNRIHGARLKARIAAAGAVLEERDRMA